MSLYKVEVKEANQADGDPDQYGNITTFLTAFLIDNPKIEQRAYIRHMPKNPVSVGDQYEVEMIAGKNPECPKLKVKTRLNKPQSPAGGGGGFGGQAELGSGFGGQGQSTGGGGFGGQDPATQNGSGKPASANSIHGAVLAANLLKTLNELIKFEYGELRTEPVYAKHSDAEILEQAGQCARSFMIFWDRNQSSLSIHDINVAVDDLTESAGMRAYQPGKDPNNSAFMKGLVDDDPRHPTDTDDPLMPIDEEQSQGFGE